MKFLLSLLCLWSIALSAQDKPCESNPKYAEFDFWIGDWEVKDTTGQVIGYNTIQALDDHCFLQEHWRGATGGQGHSINYYDPKDSAWRQTWISSNAFILRMRGGLSADSTAMVLRSPPFEFQDSILAFHQITWTPQADGTVIQHWQVFSLERKLLSSLFYGIYTRTKS